MQFILIAHDKPGTLALRHANRAAHLAYIAEVLGDAVLYGGPLLDAEGKPFGSVLIIEATDEAAARRLFGGDPYVAAGLFETSTITAFRTVFRAGVLLG